jgi:hypothetical protein
VQVIQFRGKLIHKVAARHGILRISTIDCVSGEDRRIAQILESTTTVRTISINTAHPGNARACADRQLGRGTVDDVPYDLVAGDQCVLPRRQLAFYDVEIGTADSASSNPKQYVIFSEARFGSLFDLERLFRGLEDCCFQGLSQLQAGY